MRDVGDEVTSDCVDTTFFRNGVDDSEPATHRCLVETIEPSLGSLGRLRFRRPTVDDVADPLTNVLSVIADPFVEPANQRQLQRLLRIEFSSAGVLDHVLDVPVMQIVEQIVKFVDRLSKLGVSGSECMAGSTKELCSLRRHTNDKVADLVVGVGALETTNRLRNVGQEVATALNVGIRMKCADDKPEVCCDRLLAHKGVDATLFDLG